MSKQNAMTKDHTKEILEMLLDWMVGGKDQKNETSDKLVFLRTPDESSR